MEKKRFVVVVRKNLICCFQLSTLFYHWNRIVDVAIASVDVDKFFSKNFYLFVKTPWGRSKMTSWS